MNDGEKFKIKVNLKKNKTIEKKLSEAICTLKNRVEVVLVPMQGKFCCKIQNVSDKYTSFRYNSSDNIIFSSNIDKISLDPVETDKEIANGTREDYFKPEYFNETIPKFNPNSTEFNEKKGTIKIKGKFITEQKPSNSEKFQLTVNYTENKTATCRFKHMINPDEIICSMNEDYEENIEIKE